MQNVTAFPGNTDKPSPEHTFKDSLQVTSTNGNLPEHNHNKAIPLSMRQEHIWLLSQVLPDIANNICVIIDLPANLDVDALKRSLNEIVRRHESWRTSFPTVDGQPFQTIHPALSLALPMVDLHDQSRDECERAVQRLASEEVQYPFKFAQVPLLRGTLIRLGGEENKAYQLILTLHQIICDKFSLRSILLPELQSLYQAFAAGLSSPLPDLPVQYADFTAWQHSWLQLEECANQLDYWKQRLEAIPAALELPLDRPRPPVQTYAGANYAFMLSRQLTDALKELSRREEVSLYETLAAAFTTLLHRYTRQDDVLIGTINTGRTYPEAEGLTGNFANTLVLRVDVSGNPTFRELLARVHKVKIEAESRADVPFEYMVKQLHAAGSLEQNPPIQVMLSLESQSLLRTQTTAPSSTWNMARVVEPNGIAEYDLSLELEDRPEGLAGYFVYNTDLFDEATIQRAAGHMQRLLEGIVAQPNNYLAGLPLLTEEELQVLLVEWNAVPSTAPGGKRLQDLIEEQVERTPDAIAVIFERDELSYRELNRRANQLAHLLQELGVGPEVPVGICVERSLDMIVGLLGVLKAGGAYVPLDANYPPDRLEFMLEDTQAPVVLTQSELKERLPQHSARVIYLDTDLEDIARRPDTNPVSEVRPDNLAYIIYTSGSTGKPKGVAIEHHCTVTFVDWATRFFTREQLAGVLASTSINFDLSVYEIFVPLACGGTVIVCQNLLYLASLPAADKVTLVNTVPSVIAEYLKGNELPASVRTVNLAGEPLPNVLAQRIYAQETVQEVYDLYGPTEDTTYSTWSMVEKGARETPSIGRPLPGTQAYILDSYLQPVPIGVAGELYLGGEELARCYLNRPELTNERFLTNPFSDMSGARIYKTGDLTRYRPDGTIIYLGRLDHQVKIRGFRIELGEIESALNTHAGVRESVVLAREDKPGDKRLVAYVIPKQGQSVTVQELRRALKEKLPEYMVPGAIVMLETFPQTLNGKVDRKALPVPALSDYESREAYAAPTKATEYQLLQIWEELLDVRPIGIRDNFFYLGGHSLLATRLITRIEQVFGQKLAFSTLFARPTIEQLADILDTQEDRQQESKDRAPVIVVQRGGTRRPLFFLHGDWRGGAFYCFSLARQMGADQPFYSLEPYRFRGLPVPPTFEEMAAAHIRAMRAIQPEGPYLLAGFCNGSLVAFEMARQLVADGERIDLLAIIDPTDLLPRRSLRNAVSRVGGLLHIDKWKQVDWYTRLRYTYRYLLHEHFRKVKNLEHRVTIGQLEPGSKLETINKRDKVGLERLRLGVMFPSLEALREDWMNTYTWMVTGYTPERYPGKVTYFWSNKGITRKEQQRNIIHAEEEETIIIPGSHLTMRTDYLDVFAQQLKVCLDQAQAVSGAEKIEE